MTLSLQSIHPQEFKDSCRSLEIALDPDAAHNASHPSLRIKTNRGSFFGTKRESLIVLGVPTQTHTHSTMKLRKITANVAACGIFLALSQAGYAQTGIIQPPRNDLARQAITLVTEHSWFGSTLNATRESWEQDLYTADVDGSIWFKWSPKRTGWFEIRCEQAQGHTHFIALHDSKSRGSQRLPILHEVSSSPFNPGLMQLEAKEGQTYYISINREAADTDPVTVTLGVHSVARPSVLLTKFALSTNSVDVTSGPQTLTANFTITGTLPPTFTGMVRLGGGIEAPFHTWQLKRRLGNTAQYSTKLTVPQYSQPALLSADAFFWLSPTTHQDYGLLNTMMFPGGIPLVDLINRGPADTTPPELTAVTVSTTKVVLPSATPASVDITALISDDLSGVREVLARLRKIDSENTFLPSQSQIRLGLTSGTNKEGTFTGRIVIPQQTEPGSYSLEVYPRDAFYNTTFYDSASDQPKPLFNGTIKIGP
jgi:hypothetical protein